MKSFTFDYDCIDQDSYNHLRVLDFSNTGTRRLCLHNNPDKGLQVMLIEIKKDSFFSLHCHEDSDEVVFLLEGSLRYTYDNGRVFDLCQSSRKSIIIPQGTFHSVKAGANGAIYLEILYNS